MPNYNTFDQVLRDQKLNEGAKNAFVKRWLHATYGIDFDANPGFFTELSRVHDHDNQPKHFGRIMLDTILGAAWLQLVRQPNGRWRLAVFNSLDGDEGSLVAPLGGANAPEREDLQQLKALIVAPARQTVAGLQGGDGVQFNDPNTYGGADLAENGVFEQRQAEPVSPYAVPGFLFDPAFVPGVNPEGKDASLNQDFERVVAAFTGRSQA